MTGIITSIHVPDYLSVRGKRFAQTKNSAGQKRGMLPGVDQNFSGSKVAFSLIKKGILLDRDMSRYKINIQQKDNAVCISRGEDLQTELVISVMAQDILRIQRQGERTRASYAVQEGIQKQAAGERFTNVCADSHELVLETACMKVIVDEDLHVDIYNQQGELICQDYRQERSVGDNLSQDEINQMIQEGHVVHGGNGHLQYEEVKVLSPDVSFYGLGDKTGYLNKFGYDYEMWNSDNPDPQLEIPTFRAMYKSIPFLLVRSEKFSYGIFYDNTFRTYWDLGYEDTRYFYFGAEDGGMDYYVLAGDTLQKVVGQYTRLTGVTPMPQRWTLGYHQSRWSYMDKDEVLSLAENFRKYRIPCDAIHLDIDYMDDFKVFTWDEEKFPQPDKLTEKLTEEGIKIVTIIDPGTKVEAGYDVYEEGIKENYFARDNSGEVYQNVVWPGDSVYPDYTNPKVREWWGDLHKRLVDKGVRGIWNDMNEPASFKGPLPDDVRFTDGNDELMHKEVHNIFGHLMTRSAFEGMKKHDGRRPFVITRACYSGSQRYGTFWTGDNHSIWAHLQMANPQLCNAGMSGLPFIGTDIGGFGSNTTKELLCRWVQVGCFSPLCRNHSAKYTRRQEPWLFDKETLDIYRQYINLRYHLLPYYYDLFWEHTQDGMPVMRPLVLNYEQDKCTWECNDEFMIGNSVLVAPVVWQGVRKRSVYLPEGLWHDFTGEKTYEGGRYHLIDAPLDTCPVFVKDKTILPVYPFGQLDSTDDAPEDVLYLKVWDSENSVHQVVYDEEESACISANDFVFETIHYQDDGESLDFEQGAYNTYNLGLTKDGRIVVKKIMQGYTPYKTVEICQ